jgi:hypothetical protein
MLLLYRYTAAIVAPLVLMTGCGAPGGSPGLPAAISQAPLPAAKTSGLLYVSDTVTSDVYVFSYPKGVRAQTLTGFTDPAGECVDASGDVFVTNTGASNVVEYAHGGTTPIATLKDAGYFPIGCSIDPTTGNLAVSNFSTTGSAQGDIVIYKHAKGRPMGHYKDASINNMLLCGYDNAGNFFVDGLAQGSAFRFAELAAGSSKLTNITLDQSIQSAGGVQWDGTHVAVGDQATNTIYQFAITGKHGTKVGSTSLGGATKVFQFWIDGSKVTGADAGAADAAIWKYPSGGSAIKVISGLYAPLGAVVSR